jgi:dienelactone hydrolase
MGLTATLAELGFAALGVAYFGAEGLPRDLVEIPVERVEQALEWLAHHPRTSGRIGLVGMSKGAELALLAASLLPARAAAVVAIVPSSVAFAGIVFDGGPPSGSARSSWTWRGHPVPFVPYDEAVPPQFTERGVRTRPLYAAALASRSTPDEGAIAVEQIVGPVLLLSGSDDQMWPSAEMGDALEARMAGGGKADQVEHVVYQEAGHVLLGIAPGPSAQNAPPTSFDPAGFDFGGTLEGATAAAQDVWPRIASFLHRSLTA